jgi:cytochrome c
MRPGRVSRFGGIALAIAMSTLGGAQAQEIEGHPDDGAVVFKKCLVCHRVGVGARNGVGPILNGLIGRTAGTYPGYAYSEANQASGIVWDAAILMVYLKAPMDVVPGTKMVFPGLATDQEAADVIAYLATFGPTGAPIETTPTQ